MQPPVSLPVHSSPQGHFLLFSNRHLQSDNVGKACRPAAPPPVYAHKHTRKASPSSFALLVRNMFSHQPMQAWLLRTPASDSAYARKKTPDTSLHPAPCRLKISFFCLWSYCNVGDWFIPFCSCPSLGNGIWNSRSISFWDSYSRSAINSTNSLSSLCARSNRDT